MKDDMHPHVRYSPRVPFLLMVGLWIAASSSVQATDRTWVGGADGYWGTAANWNPSGVPQNGDDLIFNNSPGINMTNNIAGLVARTLQFNHSGAVWGSDLTVTVGINAFAADSGPLAMNFSHLLLGGNVYIDANNGTGWSYTLNCITVLNGYTLNVGSANAGSVQFQGIVSGAGNLNFYAGTNYLGPNSGNNTLLGSITVTGGELWLDALNGYSVPSLLQVGYGGTAIFSENNQISTNATVVLTAGGSLLLNDYGAEFSNLVMTNDVADAVASTLDTGPVGQLDLTGSIVAYNASGSVIPTISGQAWLSDFGFAPMPISTYGPSYAGLDIPADLYDTTFTKFGNSALIIEGTNDLYGGVAVYEGILDVRNNSALTDATGVYLQGSGAMTLRASIAGITLEVQGTQQVTAETAGSLITAISSTNVTWSGPIVLQTNLVLAGGALTLSGVISGSGGLDFRNTDTVVIGGSSANSFTGTTLARATLLELDKPANVRALNGLLIVGGGSLSSSYEVRWLNSYQNLYDVIHTAPAFTLYPNGVLNLNNNNEYLGAVTFNGGTLETGPSGYAYAFQTITSNPTNVTAVIDGNLVLPGSATGVFIVGEGSVGCDLMVDGTISGSFSGYFVKQGAGTMCMGNANTYNTITLLEGGTLDVGGPSGLGTTWGIVIFDGTTLRISGSGTTGGGLEIIGAGIGGTSGAVEVLPSVAFTLNGGVLLDGPTTFNVGSSAALVLGGAISSSGPSCSVIKTGPGELEFVGSGNNTYSGDTEVNAGSFFLAKNPNVISVPGNLTIGPGPSGPATLVRLVQSGGMGGNTVTVNGNAFFDQYGNNVILSQLNLNDGGSVLTGSGTLSFSDGSTINVASQSAFGSHYQSSISGAVSLVGSLTVNVAPRAPFPPLLFGPEFDITAAISGGSSSLFYPFDKYGLGELELDGNNTYYHGVRVFEGVVMVTNSTALGNTSGSTFIYNGGSLALLGGVTVSGESLFLSTTNPAGLDSRSGSNTWTGPISLSQPSSINVAQGAYLQVLNTVSGTGGLTKNGPGTLQFWGFVANTYSGVTTVADGMLQAGRVGLTSVPGDVVVGDDTTNSTVATMQTLREQQFSPTANFVVHSSGLFDVYPFPGVPVPTPIIGTLTGAGLVNLGTGTSLTVSNAANCAFNGVISGPGVLNKAAAGTLRLTGSNTYSGTTTVSAGVLQVDGTQTQSPIVVSGGTFKGSGTVGAIDTTATAAATSPGDTGPGILTCSNFNSSATTHGTLKVQLNGATPGSGYSQLDVRNSVILSSGLQHTMSLSASLGFNSWLSNTFTIIKNDGSHPVTGIFTGLAQNGTLTIGSQQFRINYTGGDGNDVVLTQITGYPLESLAIQRAGSNSVALLWPTNDPGYILQFSTNLDNTTGWAPVPAVPAITGTNYAITNSLTNGGAAFFRLQK